MRMRLLVALIAWGTLSSTYVEGKSASAELKKAAAPKGQAASIQDLQDRRRAIEEHIHGTERISAEIDSYTDGGGTVEAFLVGGKVMKAVLRLGLSNSYDVTEIFFGDSGAPLLMESRRRYFKMDEAKGELISDLSPITEEGTSLYFSAGRLVGITDPGGVDLRLIRPKEMLRIGTFLGDPKNVKAKWKGISRLLGTSS